jgi:HD-like signal output (HDOD) protein
VGAALLGIWGLPEPVITAVRYHLTPAQAGEMQLSPLSLVHLATAFHQQTLNPQVDTVLDVDYIDALNMTDLVMLWQTDVNNTLYKAAK